MGKGKGRKRKVTERVGLNYGYFEGSVELTALRYHFPVPGGKHSHRSLSFKGLKRSNQ